MPPTPSTPETRKATTIETRRALREHTFYIADDHLDNLEWFRTTGGFDRIVTKEAAASYRDNLAAYKNDPMTRPTGPPESPPAAVLSAIVRLSKQDYHMTACGDWMPGWGRTDFQNVRSAAIAEDPEIRVIEGDYEAGWANLNSLIERKVDGDGIPIAGVINRPSNTPPTCVQGFKISHRVFETKTKYESTRTRTATRGIAREESLTGIDDSEYIEFSVKEWPLRHPEAKPELQKLEQTHIVKPLPAYDLEREGQRELILPKDYEPKLKGAIVQVEFHLNHWKIKSPSDPKGRHSFTADITKIRVLVAPPVPPKPETPAPILKRVRKRDSGDVGRGGSLASVQKRLFATT